MQLPGTWQAVIVFAALAGAALAGCGEKDEPDLATVTVTTAPATTTATAPATAEAGGEGEVSGQTATKPHGPAESGAADPRVTGAERAAAATVREYVAALDARDGRRVCALLAPGALDEVRLPVHRGDPCTSLGASIGYRDPRGLPVWEHGEVVRIGSVQLDGPRARVVVTTATTFADRDETSVEDDVVYLTRSGEAWLVAQPSSTLYRSVGIADVPPSVLAPPG
jgi:hypothetical protein